MSARRVRLTRAWVRFDRCFLLGVAACVAIWAGCWSRLSADDASGHNCDAMYEPGVVFFLPGPRSEFLCNAGETNRAAHFAGGRLRSRMAGLKDQYSVSLWFWNGLPTDARPVSGWLFSRGHDFGLGPHTEHLGLGGTTHSGKLVFQHGDEKRGAEPVAGQTEIPRWTWNHVVLVRNRETVRVHLNGNSQPEFETQSAPDFPGLLERTFFGGRCDNQSNWEGRLDEIAVFDRALSADEIQTLAR